MASAASGLAASAAWLDQIAANIVNPGNDAIAAPSSSASSGGNSAIVTTTPLANPMPNLDLATAFVDQSLALASYKANAAVFRAAEEMNKVTLSLVA